VILLVADAVAARQLLCACCVQTLHWRLVGTTGTVCANPCLDEKFSALCFLANVYTGLTPLHNPEGNHPAVVHNSGTPLALVVVFRVHMVCMSFTKFHGVTLGTVQWQGVLPTMRYKWWWQRHALRLRTRAAVPHDGFGRKLLSWSYTWWTHDNQLVLLLSCNILFYLGIFATVTGMALGLAACRCAIGALAPCVVISAPVWLCMFQWTTSGSATLHAIGQLSQSRVGDWMDGCRSLCDNMTFYFIACVGNVAWLCFAQMIGTTISHLTLLAMPHLRYFVSSFFLANLMRRSLPLFTGLITKVVVALSASAGMVTKPRQRCWQGGIILPVMVLLFTLPGLAHATTSTVAPGKCIVLVSASCGATCIYNCKT
jgi:hypothetical protein